MSPPQVAASRRDGSAPTQALKSSPQPADLPVGNDLLDPDTTAELRRIREVARFYCAIPGQWSQNDDEKPLQNKSDDDCGLGVLAPPAFAPQPPQISLDPSLTAYAQLGLFKLDCERSFISIIDHDTQYVLAEATRSISLEQNQHGDGDGLFIGSQSLPVQWGVCPSTIKTFTDTRSRYAYSTPNVEANNSRYIIRDFQKDDNFKSRSYVVGWPFMRFYAEVPLKTRAGFVIGSYCVVDNRPRTSFGDREVQVLEEISNTISHHLELTRMQFDYDRAEKLMTGLSFFVEGESSIRGKRPSLSTPRGMSTTIETGEEIDHTKPEEINKSSPNVTKNPSGDNSPALVPPNITDAINRPHVTQGNNLFSDLRNAKATPHNESSSDIQKTFQRASTLIRESMDLSGVTFLDAFYGNNSILAGPGRYSHEQSLTPKTGGEMAARLKKVPGVKRDKSGSLTIMPIKHPTLETEDEPLLRKSFCEVLGYSAKSSAASSSIPVPLLVRLLDKYPKGFIFTQDRPEWVGNDLNRDLKSENRKDFPPPILSNTTTYTEPSDAASVLALFPSARSVVFYPLWDSAKSRWYAGCVGWTTDPKRALQDSEVTYLAAFGNSVMAELGRIEAMTTGKEKTDFISNISHELRSPLHGILAAAELLQEESTGPNQNSLVEMVNSCGRTLLDTMNHLLDYAKINSLSKARKPRQNSSDNITGAEDQLGQVTDLDIRSLVEEVAEVVFAGHYFQRRQNTDTSKSNEDVRNSFSGDLDLGRERDGNEVRVILDIAKRSDWVFNSVPGAWRRIIMNLLSNALKYTSQGFVKISLDAKDLPQAPTTVYLSIADTGKGISDDYLKHRLFTPFSQEDHLAAGAGLGLSIVQEIIQQMMGTIEIESEVGRGTKFMVSIPMERSDPQKFSTITPVPLQLRSSLNGRTICLVAFGVNVDKGSSKNWTPDARRQIALKNILSKCLTDWFGMIVVFSNSLGSVDADIFLADEEYITQLMESRSTMQIQASLRGRRLLVLSRGTTSGPGKHKDQISDSVYISQPYGPAKISRALELCMLDNASSLPLVSEDPQNIPRRPTPVRGRSLPNKMPHLSSVKTRTEKNGNLIDKSFEAGARVPRVLLVEDNDLNRKVMLGYLRKLNCSVATASNGLEALETYQKEAGPGRSFDLVLTDVKMPVMDGLTATRKIRAFENEKNLPPAEIVALSGLASSAARQEASANGINRFLTKPVPLKTLKEILNIS